MKPKLQFRNSIENHRNIEGLNGQILAIFIQLKPRMTKPKAKSDSDESYVDNSSSSSEESEQDDSDFEDEKPAAKRPAKRRASKVEMEPIDVVSEPTTTAEGDKDESGPVAISRRPSKRKKKVFDENAPDVLVPSYERKTANGGYAHTSRSKSRISKANTGNTPWNKGKNRSSADRAKIAAGVRARNRAILLQKLERLKITEEEWKQKKKEIKYIRERLRIAKKANKKHEAELEKKKLDAEIRKLEEEEEAANVEAANAEAAKARFAKAKSTKAKSTKAKPARAKAAKAVAADVSVSVSFTFMEDVSLFVFLSSCDSFVSRFPLLTPTATCYYLLYKMRHVVFEGQCRWFQS